MNPLGGGVIPDHPEIFNFIRTRPEETIVEAAIRFLLAHDRITTVLVGFSRSGGPARGPERRPGIPPDPPGGNRPHEGLGPGAVPAIYAPECRYCDDCPEQVPIPELMDAYNFRLLYKQDKNVLDRLKWHWNLSPAVAAKCVECGKCEDACTQHLPIIERLKALAAPRRPNLKDDRFSK